MPRFSVIIPVYNVEQYLEASLQSVLVQSWKDFEAILVDDGSTDGCSSICDRYASKDCRFLVIHTENAGLSEARNRGIKKAQGDYIVLLDADDFLDILALENLQSIVEKQDYDLIVNKAGRYDEQTGRHYECSYEFEMKLFEDTTSAESYKKLMELKNFTFTAWIFVAQRDFLINNELFFHPGILHEDEMWTPYVVIKAKKIAYNNSHFYYYRINRQNSIMSSKNIKKEFSLNYIIEKLISDIEEGDYEKNEKKMLYYRCAHVYSTLIYNLNDYKDNIRYKELKKAINGKQKILLYRNTNKDRLVEKIISVFGIDCFVQIMDIVKIIKTEVRGKS